MRREHELCAFLEAHQGFVISQKVRVLTPAAKYRPEHTAKTSPSTASERTSGAAGAEASKH